MNFRKLSQDHYSDEELLDIFRNTKDTSYLGYLFNRYSHLVYGVSLNYLKDSEESKDTVLEIFEKLNTIIFDIEIFNFKSWLYSVTKNLCLDKLRRKKKESSLFVYTCSDYENLTMENHDLIRLSSSKGYEDIITGSESEQNISNLYSAIELLKEEQNQCITLFYLENKTYKEISEITGYSLNEVKSYVQNGKRNLKNLINKLEKDSNVF